MYHDDAALLSPLVEKNIDLFVFLFQHSVNEINDVAWLRVIERACSVMTKMNIAANLPIFEGYDDFMDHIYSATKALQKRPIDKANACYYYFTVSVGSKDCIPNQQLCEND